ncbi:MAG: ABC transporter permease [Magnetococcales bacterium]|nr:ABC transporter permease [Magnetococcales bacterium]
MSHHPIPGFIQAWRRHFLVWRKTLAASLVGSLGEPLLYLMGMGYGLGRFIGEIDQLPYLLYVASGILAASSMNTATFEALYGAFTRMTRQNTFHAMLATPLSVADVVAGEVVWAATKALIAGCAIFIVGTFLEAFPAGTAIFALPVVFLSGLVFASLGMVVTAISPSYEFFLYYFTLVATPMFLFCGVFFPVEGLPEGIRLLVTILPLTHVVALVRPLTTGLPLEGLFLHLGVLIGYLGLSFWLAVGLVRRRILV